MSGFWSSETLKRRLPDFVDPYDDSRVVNCAYELSMGSQAWVTSEDTTKGQIQVDLEERDRVCIPPGQFALLLIHETVTIPNSAIGLLSMKSKVKMRGLVNVSGFHVDPGYEGKLVFGVFNAGTLPISITQRERTFLLWYVSLDQPTENTYCGSRQHVSDITSTQVRDLAGPVSSPTALAQRISTLDQRLSVLETRLNWWRGSGIVFIGSAVAVLGSLLTLGIQWILSD